MLELFRGPYSLTYGGERLAFFLTLLFALPAAGAIGFFIHEEIGISQVALFIVLAMIYVTLGRGRLIGTSVRLHEGQHAQIFAVVKRCAAALNLPMPLVFVREDNFVPIVALGLGEPYSLVLSSHWIEHFKEDELTFMVGRELGHIASGHTRFTSLLSVNGNENPIVSLIFGAWLRRTELTCDRVGLLCCGSVDAAVRAITMASFHTFARNIDHAVFSRQHHDLGTDSIFRLGEWLGSMPYATTRIDALHAFYATQLYKTLEDQFLAHAAAQPVHLPSQGEAVVERADCAGWWRRLGAFLIDATIIGNIFDIITHNAAAIDKKAVYFFGHGNISVNVDSWYSFAGFLLYSALLVAFTGQTPGMLVLGLRVVRADFGKVNLGQALSRYALLMLMWWWIVPFSAFSRRVYLHDLWSKTRLVKSERILARASGAAATRAAAGVAAH
jgi:uncharacterized RDD family membrane protein YckC/Zn-dependent protease with chaperone function